VKETLFIALHFGAVAGERVKPFVFFRVVYKPAREELDPKNGR